MMEILFLCLFACTASATVVEKGEGSLETMPEVVLVNFYIYFYLVNFCLEHLSVRLPPPPLSHPPPSPPSFRLDTTSMVD